MTPERREEMRAAVGGLAEATEALVAFSIVPGKREQWIIDRVGHLRALLADHAHILDAACEEGMRMAELMAENAALRARIAAMREALDRVQWGDDVDCIVCDRRVEEGHTDWCMIGKAVADD